MPRFAPSPIPSGRGTVGATFVTSSTARTHRAPCCPLHAGGLPASRTSTTTRALRIDGSGRGSATRAPRDRNLRGAAVLVHTLRAGALRARGRADPRSLLARRLRRRRVPLVRGCDQRHGDLRGVQVPARHGQGRRPRRPGRRARARLQLRLQPVVRLRPGAGSVPLRRRATGSRSRSRAGERV